MQPEKELDMEQLEKSRIIGCCDEILEAVDALGVAHKGKWPPMLRKNYENAIRAAKLLRDNATDTKLCSACGAELSCRNHCHDTNSPHGVVIM
jgi:hypothetical protein